jgi:hypothetical protein
VVFALYFNNLGAFFASQKTGLSAPIPRKRLWRSAYGATAVFPISKSTL